MLSIISNIFLLVIAVISNIFLFRYKELSEKDCPTGIYNKQWFMLKKRSKLVRMMEETHKTEKQFGLLFLDMDNFHAYNDKHGHIKGDKLLLDTVEAIQTALQKRYKGTLVKWFRVRFGGDEFVVILEDVVNTTELRQAGEDIVEAIKWFTNYTVSVGGAVYTHKLPVEVDTFLDMVNKRMFISKNKGKNTVST